MVFFYLHCTFLSCSSASKPQLLYGDLSFRVTSLFFEEFLTVTHVFQKREMPYCSFLAYLFNSQHGEILQSETAVGNSSSSLILCPFYSPGKISTAESGVVTTNQHNWYAQHNSVIFSCQFASFSTAQLHLHCGRYFLYKLLVQEYYSDIGGQVYYLGNKRGLPVSRLQQV